MVKNTVDFLDKHRLILIIIILAFIVLIFISIKSFMFLHHEFRPLKCTSNNDLNTCYHNADLIFFNPDEALKSFLGNKKEEIKNLKEKYRLPEFNFYTAYYYEIASEADFKLKNGEEELYIFFKQFNNTYNLKEFYLENTFYFNIFYYFRISIN